MKLLWKIAKKSIDPLTLQKFVVAEKDSVIELSQLIDPDNLEKRFGGNCENKVDNYFPPNLL